MIKINGVEIPEGELTISPIYIGETVVDIHGFLKVNNKNLMFCCSPKDAKRDKDGNPKIVNAYENFYSTHWFDKEEEILKFTKKLIKTIKSQPEDKSPDVAAEIKKRSAKCTEFRFD